ncbi:hypothetical protein CDAR_30671 [Caerostris darwini]|uniref:Uncharacterized protein n=1 Tax=Caerostris darwini TaxID=1538125 RepID=A0AAV4U4L8_9ARAC|nr:hypothetical protein CDAR_30671 [Caerostris darwini]
MSQSKKEKLAGEKEKEEKRNGRALKREMLCIAEAGSSVCRQSGSGAKSMRDQAPLDKECVRRRKTALIFHQRTFHLPR